MVHSPGVQQRHGLRATLRDFHRPLTCLNDHEQPRCPEFALRATQRDTPAVAPILRAGPRYWFNYRKATPGGRHSGPLDDIQVTQWPLEWVREFNELLTALRRVSDIEPDQADLLDRIISGPTITGADLAAEGVKFPARPKDRRP